MPDAIGGLPLHPLVVHAAVVLLPLCALGLILLVCVPKWRRTYGWLVVGGLAVSVVFAWVAKETGEQLAEVVGLPAEHAEWGDRLVPISFLLFVIAAIWLWFARKGTSGLAATLVNIAGIVLALITIGVTVLVGHSGAEAAWKAKYAAATQPAPAVTTAARPQAPAAAPSSAGVLSMDEVAKHASATDCWSVVSGNVYDLTQWISQHPGGSGPIVGMCGKDGTAGFEGQHAGQGRPAQELANFLVGPLG